ncbi:unnamed protein product [Linum tenue]|uniref:Uncharacterized protein n=1 Tax=Linum tenue TaxID=586396 RepID=A0AAV0KVN2_9ROSI|nr:unnamed protein product [Linum tenue]
MVKKKKKKRRAMDAINVITFAKPIPRANISNVPGLGVQLRVKHISEWLRDFPEESMFRKESFEGKVDGWKVELALWERSLTSERNRERSGETTSKRSGEELRSERERVKFHTLMPKKRRTMER